MILHHFNLNKATAYEDEFVSLSFDNKISLETSYKKVYGLGERYSAINHQGKSVLNMVEEAFCNQGEKTYFPLPFFILDNGYGLYIDSKAVMTYQFDDVIKIEFDYLKEDRVYLLKGSYKEMIADFLELTGPTKKAPKWIFGPWISAHRWNSQAIVDDVRNKLKVLDIPVTAMVLEQWSDEATFYIFNGAKYPDKQYLDYGDFDFKDSPWPDPKKMIDDLHSDGIKLLLWQCPVIKDVPDDEPFNARHDREWHFTEKEKMVVQSPDMSYRIPEGKWFNGSMIPDFTNPKTVDWWFKNRQYLIDIGVDGFKTDGGEFIHTQAYNSIHETHEQMKNNYSLEYVRAYSDFLGKDRVAFSRAGYIGQQSYSLQWAGDQKSTFDELQAVFKAGINASLCGQINWGFDIGGFSGELPPKDLYYRSNQLAVFSPIMQVHSEPVGGQFSAIDPIRKFNNERTLWNIAGDDQNLLSDIRSLYYLRMNLLPYTYSEYLKALEEKTTLMKHMNIDYEGDFPENHYLYGKLLVVPVLKGDQSDMEIQLPEGKFSSLFDDQSYEGRFRVDTSNMKDMFVFIPEGTALVTREQSLLQESLDNQLDYDKVYFSLYGDSGSYRFVDDQNDFTIRWKNQSYTLEGQVNIELNCTFRV